MNSFGWWLSELWKDWVYWGNQSGTLMETFGPCKPRPDRKTWDQVKAEQLKAIREAQQAKKNEEARLAHEIWLAAQPPPPEPPPPPKPPTRKEKIEKLKKKAKKKLEAFRKLGLPEDEMEVIEAQIRDELAVKISRLFDV